MTAAVGVVAALLAWQTPLCATEVAPFRVLIVALPQVTWSELRAADVPAIHALMADASVALMPVAAPSDADPNRTWVTLGAGRAAAGGQITGEPLMGGGFQVDVPPIRAANDRAHTGAMPGRLGSALQHRRLTTALIAYPASNRPRLPPSAALPMDEEGHIDGGMVYTQPKLTPLGKRLDPAQVRSAVDEELSRHEIVLLDLTGVEWPDNVNAVMSQAVEVIRHGRARLYMLTALAPAHRENDGRTMGFLVACNYGPEPAKWLLTSASTRWPGVVTASDLAPAVLVQLRSAGSPDTTGRPMEVVASNDALAHLDRLDRMLTDQFVLEGKAARLYAAYMMLLAAATSILGAWRQRGLKWLAAPALTGVALPIGLLLCPLVGIGQTRQLAAAGVVSVALGALALWPGRAGRPLGIVLLIGAAFILSDPALGSPMMRFAPLGFGAVTGARFYGIGNEYAGVLGAMAPVGLGLMLHGFPRARWLAALIGATVVLLVGAPWWGANWGGCVSIAAGLLALWVALAPGRRWRRALVALCGVLVAAALPAALDLLRPEASRSHIGVAAAALIGGHLDAIRDTAIRKLEMNWRMARLASWWWALTPIGLLGIWELVRRSKEAWRRALPVPLRAAFMGAVVTAVVALLVNDSGVVMFGMALGVAFAACVFLMARSEAAVT